MPRSAATVRNAASLRNATIPRVDVGAWHVPYYLVDLGVTHLWDFRTAKLNTKNSRVVDVIGGRSMFWQGGSTLANAYPTTTYSADLERGSSDSFATMPYSFGSGLTALSYAVWFKRESTGGGVFHLFSDWEITGNQRGSRISIDNDVCEVFFSSNGTIQTSYASTETITDTTAFHHLVVTYDTTNRCIMTLDDVDLTVTRTSGSDPATVNSSPVAKMIGANIPSTPANFFDGLVGQVIVGVNKAFSTSEKANLRAVTNAIGQYV